jgi:coenzyme Q-binding protein COQ10
MPAHFDRYISHHDPEDLFNVVADVEKYPEFLPWVDGARIVERNEEQNYFIAELVVSFKSFNHSYKSKVTLNRPQAPNQNWQIDVEMVSGPFKYLNNNWIFIPKKKPNCTEIIFELDFKFKSLMLEKLIGILFERATKKMSESFQKRADQIYGKK